MATDPFKALQSQPRTPAEAQAARRTVLAAASPMPAGNNTANTMLGAGTVGAAGAGAAWGSARPNVATPTPPVIPPTPAATPLGGASAVDEMIANAQRAMGQQTTVLNAQIAAGVPSAAPTPLTPSVGAPTPGVGAGSVDEMMANARASMGQQSTILNDKIKAAQTARPAPPSWGTPKPANPADWRATRNQMSLKERMKIQQAHVDAASERPGFKSAQEGMIKRTQPPSINDTTAPGYKAPPKALGVMDDAASAAGTTVKGLAGKALGAVGKGLGYLGVADAGAGAYNDVSNDAVTQHFGNSLGIEDPMGQRTATGLASFVDPATEAAGKVIRNLGGYDPSTGQVQQRSINDMLLSSNPFTAPMNAISQGMLGTNMLGEKRDSTYPAFNAPYETPMDRSRAAVGAKYETLSSMLMDKYLPASMPGMPGMPAMPGMPDLSSFVAPTGDMVTPEQRAAAASQAGSSGKPNNLTVSVNGSDRTYDLNQYDSMGASGIYRSKTNPNEFIGKGKAPDPNAPPPKPAYTDQGPSKIDAQRAERLRLSDARNRYETELRAVEARAPTMGPKDYAAARENINQNYNTALNSLQDNEVQKSTAAASLARTKADNADGDSLKLKDALKLQMDGQELLDRQTARQQDRETKNAADFREQLKVLAGGDEATAKRYDELYSQLPASIRDMALNGSESERAGLKTLIPALDRQVKEQSNSANSFGGTALATTGGTMAGSMLLPRVLGAVGTGLDALTSVATRNTKPMQLGVFRKVLGTRLAGALAGGGIGAVTSEVLRPNASKVPEQLNYGGIDPNDPTRQGLIPGTSRFQDYMTDPVGAGAMDIGREGYLRTPQGAIIKLSADDQATISMFQRILAEQQAPKQGTPQ